jgi:hypothetical protein
MNTIIASISGENVSEKKCRKRLARKLDLPIRHISDGVRFIFDSFTATLMSSKTAFPTSVSELSSGDVIILKSRRFLMVRDRQRQADNRQK